VKPDPLGRPRNPWHVYLMVVCTILGAATAFGYTLSAALGDALVSPAERGFGVLMAYGGLMVLIGMFWQGDPRTGLIAKRVGYLALGIAAVIFGCANIVAFGLRGVISAALTWGLAGLSLWQGWEVHKHITDAILSGRAEPDE
jgi:hypothetical protein